MSLAMEYCPRMTEDARHRDYSSAARAAYDSRLLHLVVQERARVARGGPTNPRDLVVLGRRGGKLGYGLRHARTSYDVAILTAVLRAAEELSERVPAMLNRDAVPDGVRLAPQVHSVGRATRSGTALGVARSHQAVETLGEAVAPSDPSKARQRQVLAGAARAVRAEARLAV